MEIETKHLEVPRDFQIACESFGIMVSDFLQLIIRDFSLLYLFMHDDSDYNLATKAFIHAEDEFLGDKPHLKMNYSLEKYGNEAAPYFRKLLKLTVNKSYSGRMKREKARKLVDKLYAIVSKEIEFKPHVYLDEETKLTLSKDFLLMSAIHQYPPITFINALMRCVSLADLYARVHLDQVVSNPALGFYLRVQNGYGNLVDGEHINTIGFNNFLLDMQEFKTRYFFIRDFAKRVEVYRHQFDENFEKINQYEE